MFAFVGSARIAGPATKAKVLVRTDTVGLETIVLPREQESATPTGTRCDEVFRNFLSDIANTENDSVDEVKVTRFFSVRDKNGLGTITIPCEELKVALRSHSAGEFSDEEFRELLNKQDVPHNLNFDLADSQRLIVNFIEFRRLITNFMGMLRGKSAVLINKMNTHRRLFNGSFSTLCSLEPDTAL